MKPKEHKYKVVDVGFGALPFWLYDPKGVVVATFRTKSQALYSVKTLNSIISRQ